MHSKLRYLVFLTVTVLLNNPGTAFCQNVPEGFSIIPVNAELDRDAIGFAFLPDERILVIHHQSGEVKLIVNNVLKSEPLLTLPNLLSSSEQGLLGVAIDPDFPDSNYVYLFHTGIDSTNRVSKFAMGGELLDPSSDSLTIDLDSQQVLMTLPDTTRFHNGGTLRFGSDKTLYVSHGDDAHYQLIQNLTTPHGKILRINRDGTVPNDNPIFPSEPAEKREDIFAFGLRNPFRFTLDPETDELFIGDVGTNLFEELNLCGGGENFGYPKYEGDTFFLQEEELILPDPTFPIFAYPNASNARSPIALVTYRQKDYPNDNSFPEEFDGVYFYADFFGRELRYLTPDGTGEWTDMDFGTGFSRLVDGTLGSDGSIYVLEYGNALSKIVYDEPTSVRDRSSEAPETLVLQQNYPNPFNAETNIAFTLPERPGVRRTFSTVLAIYNVKGQEVATVLDKNLVPGVYTYKWTGRDEDGRLLPSGLYFYQLRYGNVSQTGKLILQK